MTAQIIRQLNDALRTGHCQNRTIVIATGVQALGDDGLRAVMSAVTKRVLTIMLASEY